MRRFIFAILLALGLYSSIGQAAARLYRGQIDFSGNSVTTAYELVATMSRQVMSVGCETNHGTEDFFVSVSGNASDCSDAANDVLMGANGAFVFDGGPRAGFPVGAFICVRTVSGTASTGFVLCKGWWEGASP